MPLYQNLYPKTGCHLTFKGPRVIQKTDKRRHKEDIHKFSK